jgi:hypothetical protein
MVKSTLVRTELDCSPSSSPWSLAAWFLPLSSGPSSPDSSSSSPSGGSVGSKPSTSAVPPQSGRYLPPMYSSVARLHSTPLQMGQSLTPFSFVPFPELYDNSLSKASFLQAIGFYTRGPLIRLLILLSHLILIHMYDCDRNSVYNLRTIRRFTIGNYRRYSRYQPSCLYPVSLSWYVSLLSFSFL